jgi:hypothetical protein
MLPKVVLGHESGNERGRRGCPGLTSRARPGASPRAQGSARIPALERLTGRDDRISPNHPKCEEG